MIEKSIFTMDDTAYEVSANLLLEYVNNEIFLYLEVIPDIEKEEEDWSLYIKFNTHVSNIKELNDKIFVWNYSKNQDGELAGYFNLMEEFVEKGTIKIINASEQLMTIKWSGKFGMSGKNLSSFDTTFDAEIPIKKEYVIDACKTVKIKIDKSTELEILNLQDFNKELMALSKSSAQI